MRAQVAVIGGGYTGLSAALHLAELGRDTVVLEALNVGRVRSGLNGGQVIAGVKHDPDELLARFGPQLGPKVIETVGSGPDLVFDLIAKARHRLRLRCAAGWIQPATSERELVPIRARVEQWRRCGRQRGIARSRPGSRPDRFRRITVAAGSIAVAARCSRSPTCAASRVPQQPGRCTHPRAQSGHPA